MDRDDMTVEHEAAWDMLYDQNGYYDAIETMRDFVLDLDDADVDLHQDIEFEDVQGELTGEEIYTLSAFAELTMGFASLFDEHDAEIEASGSIGTSIDTYPGSDDE